MGISSFFHNKKSNQFAKNKNFSCKTELWPNIIGRRKQATDFLQK